MPNNFKMPANEHVEILFEPDEWPVQEFRAMGSHMSVRIALSAAGAATHLQRAVDYFARAEACLSRFDPKSELSAVNANAGEWYALSPMLWEVLDIALEMASATDGLFDPTMLVAIRAAGYDRNFAEMAGLSPAQVEFGEPTNLDLRGRWQAVLRRPSTREIFLPRGTGLDLGGIAKGVIAEQVVAMLGEFGPCLVDAGGDVVAGDAPPGWLGWPVAIAAPTSMAGDDALLGDLAALWLCDATLATSGVDYRRWLQPGQNSGQWAHHILDPHSGRPATTDLVSVTVLAKQAAQAEAWAKSALILGAAAGSAALRDHRLGALLVDQVGNVITTPALCDHLA